MFDIHHDLSIKAPPAQVFAGISNPAGLNAWWTKDCRGRAALGAEYELDFGPDYLWLARVSACDPGAHFELTVDRSHPDWEGTRVGFRLAEKGPETLLSFSHRGWPEANAHWRGSAFCWALYLRLLRRHLELGEFVPYEKRYEV